MQHCVEGKIDFQTFLDNGYEYVDRDSDPDLGFDGIFGSAIEGLDSEVLFDLLEKELHPPTAPVELGDGQGRKSKVVGQEGKVFFCFGVPITNPA